MHNYAKVGLAALVAWSAGCVPLTDYRALERRFQEQETYVIKHKDQVRELERREQVITLRSREQERQLELVRARLTKSERLRNRMQDGINVPAAVPASTPKETPPSVLGLEVNPETQGLVLESGVLFEPGKAVLKAKGQAILKRLLQELNAPKYKGHKIRVEGHTDDTPIKRSKRENKSNWDLSSKRALAVLHFLEEQGVSGKRLSFAGYGPHSPIQQGTSNKVRSKNRRVEIVLLAD